MGEAHAPAPAPWTTAKDPLSRRFTRARIALAASFLLIAAFTLTPRGGSTVTALTPLTDVSDAIRGREPSLVLQLLVNVVLFLPLGFALAWCGLSRWKTITCGVMLSVGIETAQLLLVPGRTVSADDVLLNTIGALLGYATFVLFLRLYGRRTDA